MIVVIWLCTCQGELFSSTLQIKKMYNKLQSHPDVTLLVFWGTLSKSWRRWGPSNSNLLGPSLEHSFTITFSIFKSYIISFLNKSSDYKNCIIRSVYFISKWKSLLHNHGDSSWSDKRYFPPLSCWVYRTYLTSALYHCDRITVTCLSVNIYFPKDVLNVLLDYFN